MFARAWVFRRSLAQLLELLGDRAGLELLAGAEGELAGGLASHTAEDHAVQQGVAYTPLRTFIKIF